MKRDLFVFAGQSNMMGAAVYLPQNTVSTANSFEYKHKARRLGASSGDFVSATSSAGEFSYADLEAAYTPNMVNDRGESLLTDYAKNTFFCPSMSSLRSDTHKTEYTFATFSEATAPIGATLAPLLAQEWEQVGGACAYAHIAKGGVSIAHFMTDAMAEEYARRITVYNQTNGTDLTSELPSRMAGAADYFLEKCRDFFNDSEKHFLNDHLENRCIFWLQGESDANRSAVEYEMQLDLLWETLRTIGFTHFFCIRVDFFGNEGIQNVMQAQESFVLRHPDAYMLTRAASYFPYAGRDESQWFVVPKNEEYQNCRDSFYGYDNQHINEKGFSVIAKHAAKNLYRVLIEKKEPVPEEENIRVLKIKANGGSDHVSY